MLSASRSAQDAWIGVSNDLPRGGIAMFSVSTKQANASRLLSLKGETRSRNIDPCKGVVASPVEKNISTDEHALAGVTVDFTGIDWLEASTVPELLGGIDLSLHQSTAIRAGAGSKEDEIFCQRNLKTAVRAAATQPPSLAAHVLHFEEDVSCHGDPRRRGLDIDRRREDEMRQRVRKARALWGNRK
jgi:hypothetical protein